MGLVPKGDKAGSGGSVRAIQSAPSKGGGRKSAQGYDPATEESYGSRYSKPEHDVFALVERAGYRADRFYCRSTDKQGHGEKLNIRVPQGIDSQIHAAVATTPEYNSLHDFFRDAAVHRLEFLQREYNLGDDARRILELERIEADAYRSAQEIDVMTAAVANMEERCKKAWDAEDYGMLADQMDRASETIDWLREPYKGRASRLLRDWRAKAKVNLDRHRAQMEE